jgi:CelD/BcsL family acetyltransferase involved in cellulose biosynthesis
MSDQPLRVELVTRRQDIPLDARRWNALVAANETNTIFQTYEWFDAWWLAFGAGRKLYFLVVRSEDGEIVGFAALAVRRTRFGLRQLEFVGSGSADYQDVILPFDKPRALRAVCDFLVANRRSWRRLELTNIPSHSSTLALLNTFRDDSGLYVVREARVSCPTMLLRENRDRAARILDKYSLRRPRNWFTKRGRVKFRHVESLEEIRAYLPAFFDQHRRRWRAARGSSLFERASQRVFYNLLAEKLHSTGWLQFSIVEFNDQPIAFHFGFDYSDGVIWYKPAFEVQFGNHSPGLLLMHALIEDALRRDRRELDFTIGQEAFKERFATGQRHNVDLGIYNSRYVQLMARGLFEARGIVGWLARAIRGRTRREPLLPVIAPMVEPRP